MYKILVVSVLYFAGLSVSMGQIAAWDFFGQNSPDSFAATTFDPNLVAFLDSITRGPSAAPSTGANSYRTTGFKNEGISTSNNDYFQITLTPSVGYSLSLSTIDAKFGGTASYYAAPGVTSQFAYSLDGANFTLIGNPVQSTSLTMTQVDLSGIPALQNVLSGTIVFIRYYASGQTTTGGWGFLSSTAGSNGLAIGGTVLPVNTNNNDSYVQNPTTQIPVGNISSLVTTPGSAMPVFKVNVADVGSGDGYSTDITQISLKDNLLGAGADWQNTIQGLVLKNNGTLVNVSQITIGTSSAYLTLNPGSIVIPDGTSTELSFEVYLKNSVIDGDLLQFKIDHLNHGWIADFGGSGFATNFVSDVVSSLFTIDVQATELQFTTLPSSVWANQSFSVHAKATDVNNNLDLNGSQTVVLQKTLGGGTLSSTSGLTKPLTNGFVSWSDLIYDNPGFFTLTISEQTSLLSPVTSGLINSIPTGQILDESFSDGNFSVNPSWFGETGDYIITPELQLQLFTTATATDTSYLTTPVWLQLDSMEWQVYIKLGFDPSDNNKVRYYLVSDNENLKGSLNGYFVKIGENGSTDTPELFYQNGLTVSSVCRGISGLSATSPTIRLKVIRTSSGLWRLYADPTGGSSFELQATGTENSFNTNGFYTGVFCRYSTSNASGKFSFDDFYAGPVQVDTIPPAFASLSVVDSTHIDLFLSEGISLSTAQNILNYSVNNAIGNPIAAVRDAMDYTLIHLTFGTAFASGIPYNITVNNLSDFSSNLLVQSFNEEFVWYKAMPFDIQINEIFADPTPSIGLPEYEYLELFNRTVYPIDITGWTLGIGSSTVVFPSANIPANSYLLLSTAAAESYLQTFGDVFGILSSSTALSNAGTTIILKNREGEDISIVEYSDNWYGSSFKSDGGWSLEQIDPLNPCGEDANWTASTDVSGGTPGRMNSVYRLNQDNSAPEIMRASLILPDTLLITFNESVFSDEAIAIQNYTVDHGIGQPITAMYADVLKKKVFLIFNQTFVKDTIYTISLSGQVKDCAGNLLTTSNSAIFAIPDSIEPGSIVINEVLSNPYTGGTDYIEVYNNSQKIYDLKELKLAVLDNTDQLSDLFDVSEDGFYLFPDEYALLSVDPKKIISFYTCPDKKAFVQMSSMPSYNNASGRVTLFNRSLQTIDDFKYDESMHFQLLNSFQGVSLERIHPDLTTQDSKNWHSAAESAGFGTPGYKNSQYAVFQNTSGEIVIEPEVFSPDNDGRDDILNIRYKFDDPGNVATVTIFDAKGRKIKNLTSSEMLGTEGYFTWDGLNEAKQKASIGIYVIFIEIFNLDGNTSHFKKTCVLASHLN